MLRSPRGADGYRVPGHPGQRRRVLPPFPEHVLHIPHRRTAQLQLGVVHGGVRTVVRAGLLRLQVTGVAGFVAAAEIEVHAADERHVVGRTVRVPHDHELLVMAAEDPDPLVQQHHTAGVGDGGGHRPVLPRVVAEPAGVRAPQQPAHRGYGGADGAL